MSQSFILIGPKEIQRFLKISLYPGGYNGRIDGIVGPQTFAAAHNCLEDRLTGGSYHRWRDRRALIAVQQIMMVESGCQVGPIDGLIGPQTLYALEQWQDFKREDDLIVGRNEWRSSWPHESEVREFFGEPCSNLTLLELPYKMRLAWDTEVEIDQFSIHEKCAASAERALRKTLDHYGFRKIKELRLDLFGGCLSDPPRAKRGGSSLSMHSWAIAIDFDPLQNQLRWGPEQAALAHPIYKKFWQFWEEEDWISLGRERGYDFMHVQAARLAR